MELVDPRGSGSQPTNDLAPRIDDLNGKRIGLLVNGKANSELLARETARFFQEQLNCSVVDYYDKKDASRPCRAEQLKNLSDSCDFLITAVGD
jgi:hypothetical protein